MKKFYRKFAWRGVLLQLLLILVLVALIAYATLYQPGKSCTIFTAVQGDQVLYGNSEDQHNPDPVIGFFPPSLEGYGSVHFGTTGPDGQYHITDANGDAVEISAGSDGKIALTHKQPGDDYLLSINFNLAQTEKDPVDLCWGIAEGKL